MPVLKGRGLVSALVLLVSFGACTSSRSTSSTPTTPACSAFALSQVRPNGAAGSASYSTTLSSLGGKCHLHAKAAATITTAAGVAPVTGNPSTIDVDADLGPATVTLTWDWHPRCLPSGDGSAEVSIQVGDQRAVEMESANSCAAFGGTSSLVLHPTRRT